MDISAELLAEARRLDEKCGASIRHVRARAAREAHRVLKGGGWIVVAHFDWIPIAGNIVDATEQLIMQHNPHWHMAGGDGIHARDLADVAQASFTNIESFSFDVGAPYTHEAWRGRIRASAGVSASLPPDEVARFDADLATLMASRFPQDPLIVPHRVFAVVARK